MTPLTLESKTPLNQVDGPVIPDKLCIMKSFPDANDAVGTSEVEVTAELALETGVRLVRLLRRVVRETSTADVSFESLRALSFLADNPGICLSDLADFLWVGVPTASKKVDDLVERGVLSRAADTTDRRRLALNVTPQGEHMIATAKRPAQDEVASLLSRLDPAERERVRDGLQLLRSLLVPAEREASNA